jgi:hypothetical protein
MPLNPEQSTQKILLSSTSRFVGVFQSESILLTHAWPSFHSRDSIYRDREGPLSRSSFVLSFLAAQPEPRPGVVIPDYSGVGSSVASYLCFLFGKRFDSHGVVEASGMFYVPDYWEYSQLCSPWLPQNSHAERVDLGIPLRLEQCARLVPLLTGGADAERTRVFGTACRFYMRSLQAAERDPEVAYLHLITIGELLAAQQRYDKDDLLDPQFQAVLEAIRAGHADGASLAKQVRSRVLQLKRSFVRVVVESVDEAFFARTEARHSSEGFTRDRFEESIAAAYDLRSRHVHAGSPFGNWVSSAGAARLGEIQLGRPVVDDAEFSKLLYRAPTLVGLERVMRYCLFQYATRAGLLGPP